MPSPRRSSSRVKTWVLEDAAAVLGGKQLEAEGVVEDGEAKRVMDGSPRSSGISGGGGRGWIGDGGSGGSFRPLSPPSRCRSNGGGSDRVWIRRRWQRPRVDPAVVVPPAADPAAAAPPWHGGRRMLPSPVCWQHLPDPSISSPLARIPWFFHSLLHGSAVGCDGMDGFGDLLLSRSDPVVSLRPAHADPPPATMGVSRSGGVDRGRGLPAAAVSARAARTPHPVVSFFSRRRRVEAYVVSLGPSGLRRKPAYVVEKMFVSYLDM
uniref:Uncharacterized protein n=1 Tax=Oryza rufipogon TaxID=4529 RepID=A0A0E0P9L3_ORYRU